MTTVATDRQGLEVLDLPTCLTLIASEPVGRVALLDRGELVVLPVNHVVDEGGIAWRTATGSTFDAAVMRRRVTFEADHYDAADRSGWSVVVKGEADLVTDDETLARLEAHDLHPWTAEDQRVHWVLVRPTDVTGRRIVTADEGA